MTTTKWARLFKTRRESADFRGKAWKYLAHYPDGTTKTLLDVPTFDYNWQEVYILEKPIKIPKGTKIECIARFDNSTENLDHPDPTKDVHFGEQSWEEMMIGYIDYVSAASATSSGTDYPQRPIRFSSPTRRSTSHWAERLRAAGCSAAFLVRTQTVRHGFTTHRIGL